MRSQTKMSSAKVEQKEKERFEDPKELVYYHRSYKLVRLAPRSKDMLLFVLVAILDVVIFLNYHYIVQLVTYSARNFLQELGYQPTVVMWKMLFRDIPVLDLPTVYPSPLYATMVVVVSVIIMVVAFIIPKFPRLLAVYLVFLSIINICSAGFFLIFPGDFPYTIGTFSMLYLGTEVGLWMLIPLVLSLALYSMPANVSTKFIFIIYNVIYSIFFATIRFSAFLFLLQDYSVLYMAVFFFAFGPLFDFVYLVGFYSLFVSNLSDSIGHSFRRWKWSY